MFKYVGIHVYDTYIDMCVTCVICVIIIIIIVIHIKRMYGRPEGQRQDVQSEGADEDWGTITVVQVRHHPPVFLPLTGYIQVYDCMCMCTPYSTEYFHKFRACKR